jgi:glycosyltransferase involved in cell wall biosynthesis
MSGGEGGSRRTRVLFLAWGYSIHAERRIRIFSEDPSFEVVVVSTHNYDFRNCANVLLDGAREAGSPPGYEGKDPDGRPRTEGAGRALGSLRRWPDRLRLYLRVGRILFRIGLRDIGVLRQAVNSLDVLRDIETGIRDYRVLRSSVRSFRPDVVFLQTLLYPNYLAYYLPRSIPIVITFWNGDVTWWAQWNGIDRLLKRQIVAYGVRRAKAITVNSGVAEEACRDLGGEPARIHRILYPGVDRSRFAPMPRGLARERLGILSRNVVFCPRGMGWYLNNDVIVEASAEIVRRFPGTLFLFVSAGVGGEPEWERILVRARDLGIDGNVRWDGNVPWERMPEYYASADVMVSISSKDSLPNCMLEAMACGISVIMGDLPQIRDWVKDGVNGFLVPCRDPAALVEKISRILSAAPEEIEEWTGRGAALVRGRCDGEAGAKEVKRLVKRVARGGRKESGDGP